MEKMVRKRRILVIFFILAVLIPIFVYAQLQQTEETIKRLGTDNWKVALQQKIVDQQNRLNSSGIPEEWKSWLKVQIDQEQYYLDNDINPTTPGAPTFIRKLIEQSIGWLLLPLLVMVITIDIISGERSDGTIKLLLTRPIKRWKVLLSKYISICLLISFLLVLYGVLAYVVSGFVFSFKGWSVPVLTGFIIKNNQLLTDSVQLIPQWQYIIMAFGLAWFVCIIIGTLSFMVSVLVRTTPAAMGIMLAALITGSVLSGLATSWSGAKYFFSVNLGLTDYLAGQLPSIEGLNMHFSIMNLSIWGISALLISFIVFIKQDMN
ncbi:ABC transporter permease [Bacillus sp. AFS088145]|uniref:ABC transporter permease n=1 Tax=Bacillus sp. AFS088145 TaxID=2033514 RepID=UPI002570D926|nr:ABC transporter permease [Bacillus sp. AFS088145]